MHSPSTGCIATLDLMARGCNLPESFTTNPDQREAFGICLEQFIIVSMR